MGDLVLLFYGLMLWFPFAAACYVLKEIPHIWSKAAHHKLRFKWMRDSPWWTNSIPRTNSWFRDLTGINTFDDAYHFFANLPRIMLSVLLGFTLGWVIGLICFVLWFLFWKGAFEVFVVPFDSPQAGSKETTQDEGVGKYL